MVGEGLPLLGDEPGAGKVGICVAPPGAVSAGEEDDGAVQPTIEAASTMVANEPTMMRIHARA